MQHYWQHNKVKNRQAIAFVISVMLLYLILLIPINRFIVTPYKNIIAITFEAPVKSNPLIDKEKQKEPMPNHTTATIPATKIKEMIQIIKKETKIIQYLKPKSTSKLPSKTAKNINLAVINQNTKKTTIKLPSAGTILNSMQSKKYLLTIDSDFQTRKANQDDFKYKSMREPTNDVFKLTDRTKQNLAMNFNQPLGKKIVTALVKKFSLVPIDDVEKTQDSMSYCPALGRLSNFCPNSNPLAD